MMAVVRYCSIYARAVLTALVVYRWASLDDGADSQPRRPKKMQKSRFSETPKLPTSKASRSLLLPASNPF